MQQIRIYSAEEKDGLAEVIANNTSVAISGRLQMAELKDRTDQVVADVESILGTDRDNFDLFPVRTILVTTGWNLNDEVFDGTEVWAARHSPKDKPFNVGHVKDKIIGHITDNVGIDDGFNVISDDIDPSELPDKFHILTSAVVYRHLSPRDPELQQEAADIIAGIINGEWFVSMEALFNGFDYGLLSSDGEQKVVTRQDDTAFLTKYLKAYGGKGEYQDNKIGRVIRNITFSGKGLTDNPANPESKFVFTNVQAFAGRLASANDIEDLALQGDKKMADNDVELKGRISDLERKLADANQRLEDMSAEKVQATLDAKDAEITKLTETISKLEKTLEERDASYNEAIEARKTAEDTTAETQKKLDEADEKLADIQAESRKTARVATLVDKGVDKADAENIVEKFNDLDDEKFTEIAAMQEQIVKAGETTQEDETKTDESKADDETEDKDGETDDSTADEKALENAEEDTDPDMASADETVGEERGEAQAQLANYLGSFLSRSRK
jgi:hypothetical protein